MSNDRLIIVGGQQKKAFSTPTEEYTRFAQGICAVYPENSTAGKLLFTHVTPAELSAPTPERSILFKSASISNDILYACTQTEVLIYDLSSQALLRTISTPQFNDVHHVIKTTNGTLLVASTGMDMVLELDELSGETIDIWDTLKRPLWTKRNQETDYRRVLTTKPHDSHPNFLFQYENEYWVTRFEQKDAICLQNDRRIEIDIEKPHDGHLLGDKVYFTTVDGHVVIADMKTTNIINIVDLQACDPNGHATGWARGLKIIDEDHVVVAFSTLRVTKFRDNVRWIKKRIGQAISDKPEPTHIAMYNLKSKTLLWRAHLEDPKIDVVFSVL